MNIYMKPIIAAAIPLLAALSSWISTGTFKAPELALAITGVVTAIVVYFLRNQRTGVLSAAKFIGAAVTPLVSVLLQWIVTGSFDRAELATIVVGVLTSILMYLVQNTPDLQ
jgi:hypothetical protein